MKKRSPFVACILLVTILSLSGCVWGQPSIEIVMPPPGDGWITQEEIEGNRKHRREYEPFFAVRQEGAVIPGLKQGLVPQSVVYLPEQDWYLIAGYRDGGTSLVTIVDADTDELVKTVQFRNLDRTFYSGHAGGLAVSEKHLWLASGGQVHFVTLDEIVHAGDGDTLNFVGQPPIDARGSFISYSDGVLWVGDFALGTSYATKPHHHLTNRDNMKHRGWIAGYELDPATDLLPSRPRTKDGAYIPHYALSIPDKIQESTIIGDQIVLSESYGRNNPSHLYIYDNPLGENPHTTVPVNGYTVPVWFLDDKNLSSTWTLPPMVEGFAVRNDEAVFIFESAAIKYIDGSYALSRLQMIKTDVLLEAQ